jgi:hypothetical protein
MYRNHSCGNVEQTRLESQSRQTKGAPKLLEKHDPATNNREGIITKSRTTPLKNKPLTPR